MKSKKNFFVLFIVFMLLISCVPSIENNNSQGDGASGGLTLKNVIVEDDEFDVDVLPGSYLVYNSNNLKYYYASIKLDGTLSYVPFDAYSPVDGKITHGSLNYSEDNKHVSIDALGVRASNLAITDHSDSNTGEKNGFTIKVNSFAYINFIKVSDYYINEEVYSDHSILWNCIWAETDDYGETSGYRFNSDFTMDILSSQSENIQHDTYKIGSQYNRIKLFDSSLFHPLSEQNYAIIGEYLYLGPLAYKCIGKKINTSKASNTDILVANSIPGIWYIMKDEGVLALFDLNISGEAYMGGSYNPGYDTRAIGKWYIQDGNIIIDFDSFSYSYPCSSLIDNSFKLAKWTDNGSDFCFAKMYDPPYGLMEKNAYDFPSTEPYPNYLVGSWGLGTNNEGFLQLKKDGSGYFYRKEIGLLPIIWKCNNDIVNGLSIIWQGNYLWKDEPWYIVYKSDDFSEIYTAMDGYLYKSIYPAPEVIYDSETGTYRIYNFPIS